MAKPKKVPTNFIEYCALSQEDQFNAIAEDFIHIQREGGGIDNVHMLDTIRRLEMLLIGRNAFKMAAEEIKPKGV